MGRKSRQVPGNPFWLKEVGPRLRERWKAKWEEKAGRKLVRIKVIKVDRETLKTNDYPVYVIEGTEDQMLNSAKKAANVGDFIIIGDKTFRRILRGFRKCTDDDLSELIASQMTAAAMKEPFGG